MNKVFCNDLQPNTHIRVTKENGETEDHIVRKMTPMQFLHEDGFLEQVKDIEILLDKSQNKYFSYKMYLQGKSWVKGIEILS
jgi:hypothetical protein